MRVLVAGASGMIGRAVVSHLTAHGDHVLLLGRILTLSPLNQITWDPEGGVAPELPDGALDAVIQLAGESVGSGRWDERKKARIYNSRVMGNRLICQALGRLKNPPRVFLGASAVGYYGDRGDEILHEESASGKGFLAGVCRDLETEIAPAAQMGIRTVILRFGVVLNEEAGALPMMVRPFRMGMGGRLGSGQQFMSWVTLVDAVGVIAYCLEKESLKGPVIAASPQPVRNCEFVKVLGNVLARPALLPAPAFALRLALGEMADELLLASQRVEPVRLKSTGYSFKFPELEGALRNLLCGTS